MKQILLLATFLCFIHASAQSVTGSCGGSATYRYEAPTQTLYIDGSGNLYDYNDEPVNQPWSSFYQGVHHLVIGDGITSIGKECFTYLLALESVKIGSSVQTIGEAAFMGLKLKEVIIPNSVTKIESHAFHTNLSLEKLTLGTGVVDIGAHAFEYCNITSLSIPSNVENIGLRCFCCNDNLSEIVIENRCNSLYIGSCAFTDTEIVYNKSTSSYPQMKMEKESLDCSYNLQGNMVSKWNNGIIITRLSNGKVIKSLKQ